MINMSILHNNSLIMTEEKTDNSGIKYMVLLELFSLDPHSEETPWLSEEERNRAYERWKECRENGKEDWDYIFEGVEKKEKLVELLNLLNEPGIE